VSPAILLRESWREGQVTRKRTLAILSHWPAPKVERLRRVLRDEPPVAPDAMFTVEGSVPHGHIEAVLQMIRRLKLDTIIAAKRSRERDLVLALIIERLIQPCSNLAATRLWTTSTLADTFDVQHTDVDEVYAALDWLLARQERQMDGIYIIRTSERVDRLTAADAVRQYKNLTHVERAFRCLKGIDVRVRPIFHHTDAHVRAHIFLCMLAY
jgi:hypothetical protein